MAPPTQRETVQAPDEGRTPKKRMNGLCKWVIASFLTMFTLLAALAFEGFHHVSQRQEMLEKTVVTHAEQPTHYGSVPRSSIETQFEKINENQSKMREALAEMRAELRAVRATVERMDRDSR